MATEPKLTDAVFEFQVGVPVDIGWGTATLHDDGTLTRQCKGCNVMSRDAADPVHGFFRAAFYHEIDCPIMARLVRTGGNIKPRH